MMMIHDSRPVTRLLHRLHERLSLHQDSREMLDVVWTPAFQRAVHQVLHEALNTLSPTTQPLIFYRRLAFALSEIPWAKEFRITFHLHQGSSSIHRLFSSAETTTYHHDPKKEGEIRIFLSPSFSLKDFHFQGVSKHFQQELHAIGGLLRHELTHRLQFNQSSSFLVKRWRLLRQLRAALLYNQGVMFRLRGNPYAARHAEITAHANEIAHYIIHQSHFWQEIIMMYQNERSKTFEQLVRAVVTLLQNHGMTSQEIYDTLQAVDTLTPAEKDFLFLPPSRQ